MKVSVTKILQVLFVLSISSCGSNDNNFAYELNKTEYQEAVNCLQQNYSVIFTSSTLENSVSIYPKDVGQHKLCGSILKLMDKHAIDFVNFYKDSTIAFYAKIDKGIKEKQFILMFVNEPEKINDKLSSDIKIVNKLDKGCYELERVISLAN